MRLFPSRLLAIALLAACSSASDSVAPTPPVIPVAPSAPVVTQIVVTVDSTSFHAGSHPQARAVALTSTGTSVAGVSITWSVGSRGVVSISSAGVLTALAAGTDTVRATSGSVSGFVIVTVLGDPNAPGVAGTVDVALAPGEEAAYTPGATQWRFRLPATSVDARYTVIVANANQQGDQTGSFRVAVDTTGALVGMGSRMLIPNPRGSMRGSMGSSTGNRLRAATTAAGSAVSASTVSASISRSLSFRRTLLAPNVGDVLTLQGPSAGCTGGSTFQAQVVYTSAHLAFAQDLTGNAPGFTASELQQIAAVFEQSQAATLSSYLGHATDYDATGKVLVVITPQANSLTDGVEWGVVERKDMGDTTGCAGSNARAVIYTSAPDPSGQFGMARSHDDLLARAPGGLVHALAHMAVAERRFGGDASQSTPEAPWLDEGIALLMEDAAGRGTVGWSPLQRLVAADAAGHPSAWQQYDATIVASASSWMQQPWSVGAITSFPQSSMAARGAAWSLVRFVADQYGSGSPQSVLRSLLSSSQSLTGVPNLTRAAAGTSWDALLEHWMSAQVLDGSSLANATDQYASFDMHGFMVAASGSYALSPTVVPDQGIVAGSVASGAGAYLDVRVPAGTTRRIVWVSTPDGSLPAAFTGARVYIVRTK